MTTSTRVQILDGALTILSDGDSLTLDSAARHAGLTKPGLMYHFPTKEALMLGVVDHAVDRWETHLAERITAAPEEVSPAQRIRAYLDWCLTGEFDQADLVVLADPRLREQLTAQWTARIGPWITMSAEIPADEHGRLTAVRLLAEGVWFARASGIFPPDASERDQLRRIAEQLLSPGQ